MTVGLYQDILSPLILPHLSTHQNSLPVRLFSLSKNVMILRLFCGVTGPTLSLSLSYQQCSCYLSSLYTVTHGQGNGVVVLLSLPLTASHISTSSSSYKYKCISQVHNQRRTLHLYQQFHNTLLDRPYIKIKLGS